MACSLRFYGDGISFRCSLASHSHSVFPGGSRIAQPRWMLARGILRSGRTPVSPLDLSRTLPVGGGFLVPYSLSGSPVIKQLMQMVTMVPGQGGQFQSVCFLDKTQWPQLGPFCPWSPPDADNWPECPDWVRNKRLYWPLSPSLSLCSP